VAQVGETLVLSRDQPVQDHAAAPVATGFAGIFKRPAARWARVALVAVNLAAVTAFLLSYSRHGVGLGPFRIDLAAYRAGGHTWLHGGNLYGQVPVIQGISLPFTYPPIAAVLLAPLALLPMAAAGTLLTVGSIVLAAVVLRMFLGRLAGPAARSLWAVGWLLPPALLLEPVRSTLDYGQINMVLMALVAVDCLAVAPRWPRGVLTGVAAAVKLTPAAFVLFFLLRRDYRAAAAAGVSFAVTTAAGFALAGPDSVRYWTGSHHARHGHLAGAVGPGRDRGVARHAAGLRGPAGLLGAVAQRLRRPAHLAHVLVAPLGMVRASPAHPGRPRPPPAPPAGGGRRRMRLCGVRRGSPVVARQIRRPGTELVGLAAGHREFLRDLRRPRPAPVRQRPTHPADCDEPQRWIR
jgi:hypothetical protein